MWWTLYWPTPWSFVIGPLMMFAFMAICMGAMFLMMRRMAGHRPEAAASNGFCDLGPWPWRQHRNARKLPSGKPSAAFEEYREETLRRLDQEQKEFKAFIDGLRAAKDKVEFDQFMAERRNRS
jgi:hypothetical protein